MDQTNLFTEVYIYIFMSLSWSKRLPKFEYFFLDYMQYSEQYKKNH